MSVYNTFLKQDIAVELGGEDLFGHSGELFGLEEAELIPRRWQKFKTILMTHFDADGLKI